MQQHSRKPKPAPLALEPSQAEAVKPKGRALVRWMPTKSGRLQRFALPYPVHRCAEPPEGWAWEGSEEEDAMKHAAQAKSDGRTAEPKPVEKTGPKLPPIYDNSRAARAARLRYILDLADAKPRPDGGIGILPAPKPRRPKTEEERLAELSDPEYGTFEYLEEKWAAEARGEAPPTWEAWRARQPWAAKAKSSFDEKVAPLLKQHFANPVPKEGATVPVEGTPPRRPPPPHVPRWARRPTGNANATSR